MQPWDPFVVFRGARRPVWIALSLLILGLQGPGFLASLAPDPQAGGDFFQEWASARNRLEDLPVYTDLRVTVLRYLGRPLPPGHAYRISVNAHPPTSVLLALPLAVLDYATATIVWNLLSLIALGVSLALIIRQWQLPFRPWMLLPIVALGLVCAPLRQQVNHAQLNLVLLLLITGAWVADRRGFAGWTGRLLAAATAIKLFPGFLFVYFMLRRRWDVVRAGLAAWLLIMGVTWLVLGSEPFVTYTREVLPRVAGFCAAWNNASLAGFWCKLLAVPPGVDRAGMPIEPLAYLPGLARAGWVASAGAVLLLLGRSVVRARDIPAGDRAFGLALVAMLLVSPLTWEHYFLLLLLPVLVVWTHLPASTLARAGFLGVLAALSIDLVWLYRVFIPGGFPNGQAGPLQTLTVLSLQCYALLGLFAFLAQPPRAQEG